MIIKSEGYSNCSGKIFAPNEVNAFDRVSSRDNYRIVELIYNEATGELTIHLNPDIEKTVLIGENSSTRNLTSSHMDVIESILNYADIGIEGLEELDKTKNYVIYNSNNPDNEKYKYYTYNTNELKWVSFILQEGNEFYCISDSIKYRYIGNKLVNSIDVSITLSPVNNDGIDLGISLSVYPTTKPPVVLHLANNINSGLMSPLDKTRLDNIENIIGAVLELGNTESGRTPLYLKTSKGSLLSTVYLDADDFIDKVTAEIAIADDPEFDIHIGDKVLVFTLTNGNIIKVSLESWFINYKGITTPSISTTISNDSISSDLLINPDSSNLSYISTSGLLTKLSWDGDTSSVEFKLGLKKDYDKSLYSDLIYFSLDTKEIILNDISFGLDITSSEILLVSSVSLTSTPGVFKITQSNGITYNLSIGEVTNASNGLMLALDKTKLDTIESEALVNIIESIKVNNVNQPISNKSVNLDVYTKSDINSLLAKGMVYLGDVADVSTISSKGIGDTYRVIGTASGNFTNYLTTWDGNRWVNHLGDLDLSSYAASSDVSNLENILSGRIDSKVDKVEGKSLLSDDIINGLSYNGRYLNFTGTPLNTWLISTPNGPKINARSNNSIEVSLSDDLTPASFIVGDITIKGNVTLLGSSFITEAETVKITDNTLVLNSGETGAGVTKGVAGLEIDRGTEPIYKIYFDETDDRFKVGAGTDLWPIMLRDKEGDLINGNSIIWDSTTKRAKSGKNIDTELAKYLPLSGGAMSRNARIELYGTSGITREDSNEGFMITPTEVSSGGYDNALMVVTDGTNNNLQHIREGVPYKVWDEFNDGIGSGLDSDLLDGKQGSEYALKTDIPSLTGYATESWVNSNTVTIGGDLTITGSKTFTTAVNGTNGFYDTSDVRLKTNIKSIKLAKRPIEFKQFIKNGQLHYGVIALEVEELYPSVVRESPEGYKTVSYNDILVIKCKELEELNKLLKDKLSLIESILIGKGLM